MRRKYISTTSFRILNIAYTSADYTKAIGYTKWRTLRSKILLEKTVGPQLDKIFLALYGTKSLFSSEQSVTFPILSNIIPVQASTTIF
jgi:hypothetical protein